MSSAANDVIELLEPQKLTTEEKKGFRVSAPSVAESAFSDEDTDFVHPTKTNVFISKKLHQLEFSKNAEGRAILTLRRIKTEKEENYDLQELVAFRRDNDRVDFSSSCLPSRVSSISANESSASKRLCLYFIDRKSKSRWRIKQINVHFSSVEECELVSKSIEITSRRFSKPKKLLIYLNPFGGKRNAKPIFYKQPLFDVAGIDQHVILTERADHAKDDIQSRDDLDTFDGVVSVGGDGLYNEVLWGLVVREQKLNDIDLNDPRLGLARPSLRIGLIPAGSTNALCNTLHGNTDPITAALHIAIGDEIGIDVCSVREGEILQRFASTMLSYGYLGDVIKDSERRRKLGPFRYKVSGLKMILKHPSYFGRVSYNLIETATEADDLSSVLSTSRSSALPKCQSFCTICEQDKSCPLSARVVDGSRAGPPVYTHHLTNRFCHIVGVVTPCISHLSPEGLNPVGHLADGVMDLGLVPYVSRAQNATFMMAAMSSGKHLESDIIQMHRVNRFSFTPITETEYAEFNKKSANNSLQSSPVLQRSSEENNNFKAAKSDDLGTWNIDGEICQQPENTLHFRLHRRLIRVFARGIEREKKSTPKWCGLSKQQPSSADSK